MDMLRKLWTWLNDTDVDRPLTALQTVLLLVAVFGAYFGSAASIVLARSYNERRMK